MKQTTLTEKRFFEWHEDDISVTLRNKGGSYGGGSEVFVICSGSVQPDRDRERNDDTLLRESRSASSPMRGDST